MATITFDTLRFTKTLEKAGIPPAQAEAIAEAQAVAMAEATSTTLATREDVAEVRYELRLVKWMVGASLALSTAILSLLAKMVLGH